jgi:hypothetical protein
MPIGSTSTKVRLAFQLRFTNDILSETKIGENVTLAHTYAALLQAGEVASQSNDTADMDAAITSLGMTKCAAEDQRFLEFNDAHEIIQGDERVGVQYRWYDTSKAFSVRPDKNVYLIRHTKAGAIIEETEIRFLDRT